MNKLKKEHGIHVSLFGVFESITLFEVNSNRYHIPLYLGRRGDIFGTLRVFLSEGVPHDDIVAPQENLVTPQRFSEQ